MTQQPPPYNSALTRILDVEETELGAIRTRQPVTMKDFEQARMEFEELVGLMDAASVFKKINRIIDEIEAPYICVNEAGK